ncbi:MAG: N-acetylmuramoyl-L-alanine amidase [Burkholderiales bacterium]|nr:N-acetylmuramoyl-L-alanine amidase [Burkholderiales bacterium]
MRAIKLIIIHCSATANGDTLFRSSPGGPGLVAPVVVIDRMHRARKFQRADIWRNRQNPGLTSIGYHFVVYTNGAVASARHLEEIGAHVKGYNANSIGICMIGTDSYERVQWKALAALVIGLLKTYPNARVCGHRDLSPDSDNDGTVEPHEWLKTCPGFDVKTWVDGGMSPLAGHIQESA